ncbi:A-kinase anchor protein SPHKAP [Spea bombifrons]|uniref:A-kinase anchor protein SPHKAP n=1 Tax=Spea bombifrons TaxID=233779 RepID=UPI00234A9A32|nr:A-kinase anchor protein SPHKAP [Spea bombifrons]
MWPYAFQSNVDLTAMYGKCDNYGSSGGSSIMDTSTSNLGSSITACKKVLCTNRPSESLEYWLQNSRSLCRVGLVEERLEAICPSICFVSLNIAEEDSSNPALQKKLTEVSPDLPKLMKSVRGQELRENEIVLLSGLTSGRLWPTVENQQVHWPTDVCLSQFGKDLFEKNPSCIILELNKFILGLELAQESHLQPDASPLRAEDDTNCSVSSIEEDFLTASEQLEEDSEGENRRDALEELKNNIHKGEHFQIEKLKWMQNKKEGKSESRHTDGNVLFEQDIELDMTGIKLESNAEKLMQQKECIGEHHVRRPSLHTGTPDDTDCINNINKSVHELFKEEALNKKSEDTNNQHVKDCNADDCTESFDDPATTGQYATNLAECVLQDAFIRLSQSDTTFTKEAAVSISANDSVLKSKVQSPVASRPWNELPKIVIVQSPDSYDNPTEWTDDTHWQEQENPIDVLEHWSDKNVSHGQTHSTLEVALACAASVIGTISSPHTADRFKMEQGEYENTDEKDSGEEQPLETATFPSVVLGEEYSVPSALCGMTQVASAVAVCGLSEQKQALYPSTSNVLLAAADTSTAVALHCSIALGSSMEKLKDNIAKVLLKEAALVLTSPNTYRNVGEFIESINERLLSSVSSSKLTHVDDVINHDLAHNLSDAILRHSADEASQRLQSTDSQACSKTQGAFVATTTELLFNVMHFTCKKMSDLVQSGDLPFDLDDKSKHAISDNGEGHLDHFLNLSMAHSPLDQWNGSQSTEKNNEHSADKFPKCDMADDNTLPKEMICNNNQLEVNAKKTCSKQYMKRESYRRRHNEHRVVLGRESSFNLDESKCSTEDQSSMEGMINSGSQEKLCYDISVSKDFPSNLSTLNNYMLHPSQAAITLKLPANNYCLTDFADDLAETVVSMATEIAAVCLENSHGKQPWFCAWAKGSECLMTSCRTMKRKKDVSSGGAVVRRHRPPRLSEIKKKTDEHPELKERLMNRVVDESINLEDTTDPVSAFANEVASKILNLTESSVGDTIWQGQNVSRNRLHCDRWSRGKASSYESIPEEDLDAKNLFNTLGPGSLLGQPFSRTSSVSKQSSCESITDEFSRFMVNQMENEGREFELLLDYYAGKNANNILNSALQQVSRRNSHLNVRSACVSKQSSTESITEEFYRYMLKEIDKENKDVLGSRKTAEWTSNLMPPSPRTPFCFRQSSMPCNRSSSARLTVNAPIKANSLDGFSRSGSRDFLHLQPVSAISSTNLCKSDSCLYQRCQTDQATDLLIHETWSNSIEALMRKNKIITDSTDDDDEVDLSPKGSPAHVDSYANKLAADIVQSGKSQIILQDSFDGTTNGNVYCKSTPPAQYKHTDSFETVNITTNTSHSVCQPGPYAGQRGVPLIQIETDQRDTTEEDAEGGALEVLCSKDSSEQDVERIMPSPASVRTQQVLNTQVSLKEKPKPDVPIVLSSSEDSTGSWSQLANEEENPEDTSSFLQLSERSTSKGNSSTSSSMGATDLDYLEVISPAIPADLKLEEGHPTKEIQENPDECTSGLSVGTASCQMEICIINVDLESDRYNSELRTTLQWIAASELGIPAVYFKNSQEHRFQKFLEVSRMVQAKSWKVGDIWSALILHCKMQAQGSKASPSFFDWLLEMG